MPNENDTFSKSVSILKQHTAYTRKKTSLVRKRKKIMARSVKPEIIANYHCEVGENPLWDDERNILYWTDIPRGRLFRYFAEKGTHERFYSGDPVGGFAIQRNGGLLLFQS